MNLQQESDHKVLSSHTRTSVTVIFQFLLPGFPSCASTIMHLFFFSQKQLDSAQVAFFCWKLI
jgi:hypothetical protein